MIFPPAWQVMAKEGHLMVGSFLNGFDMLNKSSFDRPGSLYSCFFQLSTGLERLMKIAFILDYKSRNSLSNPSDKDLRKLGHNLLESYEHCRKLGRKRQDTLIGWFESNAVEYQLLAFLTEFANGNRYYNLNQLVGGRKSDDPLTRWFYVHVRIAETYLTHTKREAIMQLARNHCDKFGLHGWELGPRGEYDPTIDVTYQLEVFRRTRGHCVWTLIKLLKPFYRLLDKLCEDVHTIEVAQGIASPTVPYLAEFVSFFLCDKQTSVRRKTWLVDYPR